MKICIFERSNDKNYFSKTKIYFHQKTTPQLLGHVGLQNMKVGEKTNFGRLATIFKFVQWMLTSSFQSILLQLFSVQMCIYLPSSLSEVSQVIPLVLLQQWKQGEVNYLREEVNSSIWFNYFTTIIFCLNVYSELHLTIGVSPDMKSLGTLTCIKVK